MIEKLVILSISVFLILIAGSSFMFPIYLQVLMDRFNFTLTQINLYGSCILIGAYGGFPIGMIYDYYGSKISLMIGICILVGCHFLLYVLFIWDIFIGMPIYPLLIIAFMLGQGSYLLYITALGTNLKNFSFKQNSTIVCILLANFVIFPNVLTTFKFHFSELHFHNFNLYFALFIFIIGMSCFIIIKHLNKPYQEDKLLRKYQKFKEKHETQYMLYYNMISIFIFIFGTFVNYYMDEYVFPLIILFPLMQLGNFVFIILEYYGIFDNILYPEFKKKMDHKIRQIELSHIPNMSTNQHNLHVSEHKDKNIDIESINTQIEIPFQHAIISSKLILIFISIMFGIGSTLSNINNINFILKSITYKIHYNGINNGLISIYKSKELFLYVIIYFSCNALIRICSSILIDYFHKRNQFSYYFIIFSFIGLMSQIIGITMNKTLLYISIALAGTTHGAYITFIPIFIKREFGLTNIGKIQGIIMIGISLGIMILSNGIFMSQYKRNSFLEDGIECYGKKCFILSYIITSLLFIINVILGYCLYKNEEGTKEAHKDFAEMLKKKNII